MASCKFYCAGYHRLLFYGFYPSKAYRKPFCSSLSVSLSTGFQKNPLEMCKMCANITKSHYELRANKGLSVIIVIIAALLRYCRCTSTYFEWSANFCMTPESSCVLHCVRALLKCISIERLNNVRKFQVKCFKLEQRLTCCFFFLCVACINRAKRRHDFRYFFLQNP